MLCKRKKSRGIIFQYIHRTDYITFMHYHINGSVLGTFVRFREVPHSSDTYGSHTRIPTAHMSTGVPKCMREKNLYGHVNSIRHINFLAVGNHHCSHVNLNYFLQTPCTLASLCMLKAYEILITNSHYKWFQYLHTSKMAQTLNSN